MNTWNHALELIHQHGFETRLSVHTEDGHDEEVAWWECVRKDGGEEIVLCGDDPLSLLGIVLIWEKWGESWRDADIPDWHDIIYTRHFGE